MNVLLIRHGQTDWNCQNKIQGWSDVDLNNKGISEINDLCKFIKKGYWDYVITSDLTRAKQTAKYIANKNNMQYNLDKRLCERKLGNIEDLAKFMNDKETRDPSREQLAFPDFKTRDGESANETNKRMNEFINEILEKYNGERIVVISHGGSIKFYLLSYCKVNNNLNLEYKEKELNITSPCLLKLTFRGKELLNIEKIQ